MISVVIIAYNEGDEVRKTVESVRTNTSRCEIILVDDGSTDGSCSNVPVDKLVRHEKRSGIVFSRRAGVAASSGDTLAFLDGHQRVSEGCLNVCAGIAIHQNAIVYPSVYGLVKRHWTGHGATMQLKNQDHVGLFGGRWIMKEPRDTVSRISMFIVPGYVMDRVAWSKCELIEGMQNWGASEPALAVKAFFTDTHILHHKRPVAQHMFRAKGTAHYPLHGRTAKLNHLRVARVCFEPDTYDNYWRKSLAYLIDDKAFDEVASDPVIERQRLAFREIKVRSDSEFWRGLLHVPLPEGVAW